jgi:methyl-accepting chemotaxis protein
VSTALLRKVGPTLQKRSRACCKSYDGSKSYFITWRYIQRIRRPTLAPNPVSAMPLSVSSSASSISTRASLIFRILLAATAAVIVSFSAFSLYNDLLQRRSTQGELDRYLKDIGGATAENIASWLNGRILVNQSAAEMIGTFGSAGQLRAILDQKALADNFRANYLGEQGGQFTIRPDSKMPDGYDPRKRPWYQAAISAQGSTVTEPYVDAQVGGLVLTVATPVRRNGELIGVLGGDLSLETVVKMVNGLDLGGMGHAFLVNAQGKILVHPDNGLVTKSLFEAFPAKTPKLSSELSQTEQEGKARLVTFAEIPGLPANWYVGLSVERGKAYAALSESRRSAVIATLCAALVMITLLGLLINSLIARPLNGMTGAMQRLAEGDLGTEIPGRQRRDEIGAMATAVQVFKENALERKRLEEQGIAERAAKERRVATVEALINSFDQDMKTALETVTAASGQLETTATSLSRTAEESASNALSVAAASEQASVNVRGIAAAAEELSTSISEIARRIETSKKIADRASASAEQTDATVQSLVAATQRIERVVGLINEIASQTNLLALNATIEAARAGDAGKGFAVVASEVKTLSAQTAKATEEIAQQINEMQSVSNEAARAIRGIGEVVAEINGISTDVAEAMNQQGSATQEIAHSVHQAAQGTQEVSANITGVTEGASRTGTGAAAVLSSAGDLARQSDRLRTRVEQFFQAIRAA